MSRGAAGEAAADARRRQVRARYGAIASGGSCGPTDGTAGGCCGSGSSGSCCGNLPVAAPVGYSRKELASVPPGSNLGLGCGNPATLQALRPGQVILDLGSGAGIDCFLAARKVGSKGHVIGVDMTPEMVGRARESARTGGYSNVEFRLGEIEHLPVADGSVDVVISNCVINLAPAKAPVYDEAFRVLRPGGRLAVSDMVATRPISARDRADPSLWSSCSSGALQGSAVKRLLRRAGFRDVRVDLRGPESPPDPLSGRASMGVVPADIRAVKPGG